MAVVVKFSPDDAKMFQAFAKQEAKLKELQRGYGKVGAKAQKAGKKSQEAFGDKSLSSLTAYVGGLVSVGAAIAAASRGYETWLKNIREFGAEARKAGNELIAFAALQEGGTKAQRVRQASALGVRFGITDRGAAFDVVQSLQSILGGDFEGGMAAAATVFAATQVGIPLEDAAKLEALGISQKQGIGTALRRAFVAGQASAKTPAEIATAGPGLEFFANKEVGFAAAAVLATPFEGKLETFTKAAGLGLSTGSAKGFQETFEKLGVEKATRLEKLDALLAADIVTVEQLQTAGLTEIRQRQALNTLLTNLPEMKRILKLIETEAVPGLLVQQRKDIEKEIPEARFARQISIGEAAQRDAQAFGPRAIEALREDRLALIRGRALRSLNRESAFWFDVIDETGRTGPKMFALARLRLAGLPGISTPELVTALSEAAAVMGAADFIPRQRPPVGVGDFDVNGPSIQQQFEKRFTAGLEERIKELTAVFRESRSGPTLGRPDEDR